MVNLTNVVRGGLVFAVGFFLVLILDYLAPPLVSLLDTGLREVIWFGIILIYLLAMLVLPIGLMVLGLMQPSEDTPIFGMTAGVLHLILAIGLSIKGWFMISASAQIIESPFTLVLFWVGFTLTWITLVIVTPIMKVLEHKQG